MSSIISIASYKGGVGKTVTTLNLGMSLANQGHKVLLLDGDPQGILSMSVDMKKKSEAGLSHILRKEAKQEDVVVEAARLPLSMAHMGVDTPADVFNLTHGSKAGRLIALRDLVKSLAQDYDYTLIDTASNVSSFNATLLSCGESVIIPVSCKSNTVKSLPLLLKLLKRIRSMLNPDLSLLGLMLPMLDTKNPYELEVLSTIRDTFPQGAFFSTFIPYSTLFEKAEYRTVPVSFLAGAEEVQQAYDKFAQEVLQRLEIKAKGDGDDEQPEKLF